MDSDLWTMVDDTGEARTGGREQVVAHVVHHGDGVVADAQRRLLLVLRAEHGPQTGGVWCRACSRAGVVSTGQLSADELDRVAAVFAEGTGADAVAGRTCRVRLLFLRTAARTASVRPPLTSGATRPLVDSEVAPLRDRDVQAAFHQPDALDEAAWLRRLAQLEREVA